MRGGDISAIYAGTATEATPMPMPPMQWKTTNTQMLPARPAPSPQIKNSPAASFIIARRPILSAIRPVNTAPTAAPISAAATAKPKTALPISKWPSSALTAPLVTEMSYPNHNPPSAATDANRTAGRADAVSIIRVRR
jgi:hypothetical protein